MSSSADTAKAPAMLADAVSRLSETQLDHKPSDGGFAIDTWLEVYAAHCHDHADQVRRAAVEAG